MVENAQEGKTKAQKFLDRFANIYTPSIVVLAVAVYAFTRNVELALTFLVIACPGALVISAPVSMVAGIGNGARNGVLIKGGDIMEKLAKVNAVVFDKTGTLTKGRPEVTDVKVWVGSENDMLHLAAQAEVVSEHHLGQTIGSEAQKRGLTLDNKPEHAEIIEDNGMVAIDGVLTGLIGIADQIKPEAHQAIARLRAQGVQKVYMLSGDNRHTAQLVGDGINDAPALAAADVGLAMGMGGADITMETADVVLMSDRLDHSAHAHGLAKATVNNMLQNTLFAVGTVVILLAGVVLGTVFLSSGMLIHEISVLLVIVNAIRLVRYKNTRNAEALPAGADARVAGPPAASH